MLKEICDWTGRILIREENAEPVCGKDFCDDCGDCLACYIEDPCYDGSVHRWVEYDKNWGPEKAAINIFKAIFEKQRKMIPFSLCYGDGTRYKGLTKAEAEKAYDTYIEQLLCAIEDQ